MNENAKAKAKGISTVIRTHESAIAGATGHKRANFEQPADSPRKCRSN